MDRPIHIPWPITFVRGDLSNWRDVITSQQPVSPNDVASRFRIGVDNWIVQAYLWLKRRGHDVMLSDSFIPGSICVAHYDEIVLKRFPYRSYIVAVNADRPRAHLCAHRIVQSPQQVCSSRDHFIAHWPQPGLVPRDRSRGCRLERIAHVGNFILDEFNCDSFHRSLGAMGVELITMHWPQWMDFRNIDAVLAVRRQAATLAATKPPTKLINAWWANCIAMLGPEPAFRSMRQCEDDYIEVSSPDDVLAAVARLNAQPQEFARMIANGVVRREGSSVDAVCRQWEAVLAGPVSRGYEQWRAGTRPLRTVRRCSRSIVQCVHHLQERRRWNEALQQQ